MPGVMLAFEMRMIRGAIAAMLEMDPDLTVVGEAEKADSILRTARLCRPDVIVLDADLRGASAIDITVQINRSMPACRTLLITRRKSSELVRSAISVNASGLLFLDSPACDLTTGIKIVASGEQIIDQKLAIAALSGQQSPLTNREADILAHAAAGAEPNEIAEELGLRIGTVRNYLTVVVTKLGARNRVDAIRIADESGWLLPTGLRPL